MVRYIGLATGLAILVALWVFPAAVFPSPGTNDAIVLANLELPLLLVEIVGATVAFFVFRSPRAAVVRVGVGVFLLGVAIDFAIGLAAFGNLSNDRFAALIFLPVPIGIAGLVAAVVGAALASFRRPELIEGALYGIAAAIVLGAWTLVRGSRDWLLAPYGFDIILLIPVLGTAIVLVAATANQPPTSAAKNGSVG